MKNNKTCSSLHIILITFISVNFTPAIACNIKEELLVENASVTTTNTFNDLVTQLDFFIDQEQANKALKVFNSLSQFPEFNKWDLKDNASDVIIKALMNTAAMHAAKKQPELQIAWYERLLQMEGLERKLRATLHTRIGMIHFRLKNWLSSADECLKAEQYATLDEVRIITNIDEMPKRFYCAYLCAAINALENIYPRIALKYFTRIEKLPYAYVDPDFVDIVTSYKEELKALYKI